MITKITGLLILIGIIFSAYFVIDKRYALSETVKLIEQRLDQKITSDQYNEIQKRIWAIEDRYYMQDVGD